MAATAVTDGHGLAISENDLVIEYEKLIRLRDDVFADNHPRLKLSKQSVNLGKPLSTTTPPHPSSSSHVPNGVHPASQTSNAAPAQALHPQPQRSPSGAFQPGSPNVHKVPTPAPGSSGIDPILLTKSDVLVRAEFQQKRQRIERVLEEQLHRKRAPTKQKMLEQEALPAFSVTEILRKAQELVKPLKLQGSTRANGAASSSVSFDENTFYSSQMESTTTEGADESHKWRPHRICEFFLNGRRCQNGDACTLSHDPMLKQKLEAEGSQAMDLDSINADEQASSRQDDTRGKVPNNNNLLNTSHKESSTIVSTSQTERMLQQRVAQLEAELRNSKGEQKGLDAGARPNAKETHEPMEESVYSPPGPDEFGRDIGLREKRPRQPINGTHRPPSLFSHSATHEYIRRNERSPSPIPNNIRVARNTIRSPVAPQPSRVSPLAVAKVPQISQMQREYGVIRHLSRASNAGEASAGQSPKVLPQTPSSRKRRRGLDPDELARNVVPRRGIMSPGIRIKDEPVSPRPFGYGSEVREDRRGQDPSQPLYIDPVASQHREREPLYYQPRVIERPAYGQPLDDRGPSTPITRRIVSRDGQQYVPVGEQDLRRVVSARQVRAAVSPAPYPVQYSAPQPRAVRVASPVYVPSNGQSMSQQYRASVQPQSMTYTTHDRSPSPPVRRTQLSPGGRKSIAMAPPPRRIMIDQWGRECIEVPITSGRQLSIAPVTSRSEFTPRYEQNAPRSASVRQPQLVSVDDEGQYIRRVSSPAAQSSFEYPHLARSRQTIDPTPRSVAYAESYVPRNEGSRVVEYPESRLATRYLEGPEQHERMVRMQSARPIEGEYEAPREQFTRVQSVRPQQPRIVKLGEKPDSRPQLSRQVSVVDDNGSVRPATYAMEERPRYQYAHHGQGRGYVEEDVDDGGLYDTPESMGRWRLQRM